MIKNRLCYLFSFGPLVGLICLLSGCSSPSSAPQSTGTDSDANGGAWKTIVLSSAAQVSASSPSAPGSSATIAELAAVKSAMESRSLSEVAAIRFWDSSAVVRWNEIARQLVKSSKMNPPMASRLYALLSIAQYDAAVTTWRLKYYYNRLAPAKADPSITPLTAAEDIPSYPSDHAAIASTSARILAASFPLQVQYLDSLVSAHEASRIQGGYNYPSDVIVGDSIGTVVASYVLAKAATDNSTAVWSDTIPVGPQYWYSKAQPPVPPLLPLWGKVGCWVIKDMSSVEVAPAPAFGSAAYLAGLHEVRQISDTRTAEQDAIAKKWSDDPGNTSTPSGHWNAIASSELLSRRWSTLRSARALALMNMAMMDAGVCCWKTKYDYWLIRPSEADTMITLSVPLPNFPSYCSGHSSFSGSASEVLGYLMPDKQADFSAMAQEASISRVYGGIHYRFDCESALAMGKKVGDLAIAVGKADGSN